MQEEGLNTVKSQRQEHAEQLALIRKDINQIKNEGRIISGIQLAAIALIFFFGVSTLSDFKKKLLK